jgi:hypothetical protein
MEVKGQGGLNYKIIFSKNTCKNKYKFIIAEVSHK